MSKNCIVAQSGGPTAAINASLAGVIGGAMASGEFDTVYGSKNGVLGILNDSIIKLSDVFTSDEKLELLKKTPATYLGSCRYKLANYLDDDSDYIYIFRVFEKLNIGAFFYIGGNDSMDTVAKLSAYAEKIKSPVRIIGIPKTIDNDLVITDHTPGFGSAAKYVATSVLEIAMDAYIYANKSVTIIEIMGRDAGWLTAASALARNEFSGAPHLIYLPEVSFDREAFLIDVKEKLRSVDNVVIAISEGIHDFNDEYISATSSTNDNFGHSQLSGAGKSLEFLLKENINVKVRSVELNVLQRCAGHITSATDLEEAYRQGEHGVKIALEGQTSQMTIIKRVSNEPYTVEYSQTPVSQVANEAKSIPRDWINITGNDVKEDLVAYLKPLIMGEVEQTFVNGIPSYISLTETE